MPKNKVKKAKRSLYKEVERRTASIIAKAKSIDIEVKGKVNAGKLNIRKEPKLTSRVIGQFKRGDITDILNELDDWYQILYKEKVSAYVFKKYIDLLREEKSGVITARNLNIRVQPNTDCAVLGTLHKNDIVVVLKELNNWLKINHNGHEAYIYKRYVDVRDVPIQINPAINKTQYFYQRKDLADHRLEAKKKIRVPKGYHEAIAAKTWNNYGGLIEKISDEMQIDVATALSVLCVESSGHGFKNDKMIIRFENHVLDLFWGKHNVDKFEKYFKYDKKSRRNGHYFRASEDDEWETCHTSQQMEWKVLNFARTLDDDAALKSISMGAPQIMGFNHKFIGYKTPQLMFKKFSKDIRYHLLALFDFCKYKPKRIRYLQKRDFYQFSVEYNGTTAPAQYEKRLKKYYDIFRDIL